ncbi:MAG: GspH/FimT family pseudopilin [Pseudomonadota bacterium]
MERNSSKRVNGFTLFELLVTLAIAGLLLAIGAPAWSEWSARARVRTTLFDLAQDIAHARRLARGHSTSITLCAKTLSRGCAPTGDFSNGWLVFVNTDNDRPAVRDDLEPVLIEGRPAPGVRLEANRTFFYFAPPHRRSTNGTFTACDETANSHPRSLVVSYTGRGRVSDLPGGLCE